MDGSQEAKLAVIIWEIVKQLLGEKGCVWGFHGNRSSLERREIWAKVDEKQQHKCIK